MGQVYQATDTKLNRQVALKILPEAFAADPDRLARFQREAKVLASLNQVTGGNREASERLCSPKVYARAAIPKSGGDSHRSGGLLGTSSLGAHQITDTDRAFVQAALLIAVDKSEKSGYFFDMWASFITAAPSKTQGVGRHCQLKGNPADRPPTYPVHNRTRVHHLGGRPAEFW